jgi:hypothetical protein
MKTYYRRDFRKNPEKYFWESETPNLIEGWFDEYKIKHKRFSTFLKENRFHCEDSLDVLQDWYEDQEANFAYLWFAVTREVFYLLFWNRRFLLEFNKEVSAYISSEKIRLPAKQLNSRGRIRRVITPEWVKKSVYCLDRGRCLKCNRDLSHMLSTDRKQHYDHMVPLEKMGINDPTNIQLLCDACNRKKSSKSSFTSSSYADWW